MRLANAKIFGDFGAQVMLPTRMLLFLPHSTPKSFRKFF
jgi:hypothetical protein